MFFFFFFLFKFIVSENGSSYKDEVSHIFFPIMAISFLRLSKVSRKKFLRFSLEVCFSLQGRRESFRGHKKPCCVQQPLAPKGILLLLFGCVCLTSECVSFLYVCIHECVCVATGKVCLYVCLCFGASACSWRRGDGVQVLHQALEMGHLLGQLVGLVALRERNRVTARGGRGAGGEGGKHLEGGKEESRGKERRRGEGQSGIFHKGREGGGVGRGVV